MKTNLGMQQFMRKVRLIALGSLILTGVLLAQPPAPAPQVPPGRDSGRPTLPPHDTKDPTVPNERIRELLNASKVNQPVATPKLPTIHLRGRIISKRRPPTA